MRSIRVFRYIPELDAFVVSDQYRKIADEFGLTEWNPVVWIGRLFLMDNDFGEHWFDNWDLREQKQVQAEALGIDDEDLLIIDPERFQNGADGPCNSDEIRKLFWRDVLMSFELSCELLFAKVRERNERVQEDRDDEYIEDLEDRIEKLTQELEKLSGPVGLGSDEPRRISSEHDSIYDEP